MRLRKFKIKKLLQYETKNKSRSRIENAKSFQIKKFKTNQIFTIQSKIGTNFLFLENLLFQIFILSKFYTRCSLLSILKL